MLLHYLKKKENTFDIQMQMRKYVYGTADSEHCFDLSA